jgi:hypothetical protein
MFVHEQMIGDKPDPFRFHRVITRESPTRHYSRDRLRQEPLHAGQMKLLLSEIEFLTPFFGKRFVVVYAGAAPGVHMPSTEGGPPGRDGGELSGKLPYCWYNGQSS